jgi:peptide/nickel transport system substrate-binding protein
MRLMLGAALAALVAAANPALAQKSADTLRLAVNEPYRSMSPYHYPQSEGSFVSRTIFQTVIGYDARKRDFVPIVAKAWKRIDDTTLDFELFDDIAFHSGNKLTADDVVYTLKYTADPKVNLQFKPRYTWFKDIEKTGPYSFRVRGIEPNSTDLAHFAFRAHVFDSKVHAAMDDAEDYGRRSPVGSGPFAVANFDRNKGATLERAANFKKNPYERAPVKKIEAIFLPDEQTRVAHLIAGSIDVFSNVSPDNAAALAQRPGLAVTATDTLTVLWMHLDAVGRAGKAELKDPRVRRAMFMAIDRDAIIQHVIPGGSIAKRMNAMCFDAMLACGYAVQAPAYDPAGARKLLVEAGYPNGFDFVLDSQERSKSIAEAIGGMLQKVGIRTSISAHPSVTMQKRWTDGEQQGLVNSAPAATWPDASYMLDLIFSGEARDTVRDAQIIKAYQDGRMVPDAARRQAIYKLAFDRMNELASHLPIASMPDLYAHRGDVRIEPNPLTDTLTLVSDVVWN